MTSSIERIAEITVNKLQDIIGTDAGGRGMKNLICDGDLVKASRIFAALPAGSLVVVLTGFPCCVNESPPTETDGPPGAVALARAAVHLGHTCKIVTDECNEAVFQAAIDDEKWGEGGKLELQVFSATKDEDNRLQALAKDCDLVIACERAGPGEDGNCYTMRGINMNERNIIAPLHKIIQYASPTKFLAVGDGGNEMGMGKVIDKIKKHIPKGDQIGCIVAADHLVAASVSNWGGYAVAAGAAVMQAAKESSSKEEMKTKVAEWVEKCVPTEQEEIDLLNRCVAKGCRDGVSGKVEATVDGMPLATSLKCLRDLREAALSLGE
eukprot:CAMPEP_0119021978 /NCGR_PEP_ID=MMETSP1176-20130426/27089_1 /TAXON_ID=265551 /ORGANISM="Synedropsis recta cf, Strain CCMP1620" /LENGTH=323 /DNA_ID=CAMNT_0006976701 /DNA_START=54 /DNA_END=1025 /DNA_ORIENTATION=+